MYIDGTSRPTGYAALATIYELKPAFQGLLRRPANALARAGVTANQVTLAALALSALTGGLLAARPASRAVLAMVPVVLFLRMALNAIDGMLAREHGMKSKLGAVLNELGDVLSDALLYLPFAFIPGVPAGWVVLVVLVGILGEMTGVVAVQIGASRRYDGPFGKSDRAFLFGLLAVLLAAGIGPGAWLGIVLAAACALGVLTVFNRARAALREAR
jgi:CDP-diacylglycerol--glycerol-3-phosphate 3-phosphatidyltransferase